MPGSKAVNDAVSAKVQTDTKTARVQVAATAFSNAGGGCSAFAHRGGKGYRTPSHNGG